MTSRRSAREPRLPGIVVRARGADKRRRLRLRWRSARGDGAERVGERQQRRDGDVSAQEPLARLARTDARGLGLDGRAGLGRDAPRFERAPRRREGARAREDDGRDHLWTLTDVGLGLGPGGAVIAVPGLVWCFGSPARAETRVGVTAVAPWASATGGGVGLSGRF